MNGRIPFRPGDRLVGDGPGWGREEAVLALPRDRSGTPRRTTGAPLIGTPDGRAVALVVCGRALRHREGRQQVMEDLFELGLLEDPLSKERAHFGKAPRSEAG